MIIIFLGNRLKVTDEYCIIFSIPEGRSVFTDPLYVWLGCQL